jgi:hypothetical protein
MYVRIAHAFYSIGDRGRQCRAAGHEAPARLPSASGSRAHSTASGSFCQALQVAGPSQAGCALACAGAGALLLVQSTGHHHHRQPRSSMWRSPLPSSSCVVIALLLLAHAAQHAAPSPVAGLPPIVFSAAFAAGGADQPLLRTPKRNGEEEDHRRENDRQDDSAAACLRGPYPGETPRDSSSSGWRRSGPRRSPAYHRLLRHAGEPPELPQSKEAAHDENVIIDGGCFSGFIDGWFRFFH